MVALINGLFKETFPKDSQVIYNATENIDGNLRKTVADIIITLQSKTRTGRFHLEGQITNDNTIVLRMFEYGFHDAVRHQSSQDDQIILPFPTPVIIFLEHTESTPDTVTLTLDFGKHGTFSYPVPTIKFLDYSVDELCENDMFILLPLYLLKLRRMVDNALKRKHGQEQALRTAAKALKSLIEGSILPGIHKNKQAGHITSSDAFELLKLLGKLYDYLYAQIEIFHQEEVKEMLVDTLVLEYDVEFEELRANYKARVLETARRLKNDGVPITSIVRATELPYHEVENL